MEPQEPHYSLAVGHRKRHKAFTLIRPLASLTKGDGNVANEPLVRSSGKEPDAFQKLAKAFSRWMSKTESFWLGRQRVWREVAQSGLGRMPANFNEKKPISRLG